MTFLGLGDQLVPQSAAFPVLSDQLAFRAARRTQPNHPGFDAHLLSRDGCSHHAEEVRRGVHGPGGAVGDRPCRGVRHPHGLHHRGCQTVGNVLRITAPLVNQVEVDTGVRDGVPTDIAASTRSSSVRIVSVRKPSKYSRPQHVSSCGRATRDTADLCVHCRASCSVRGRSDLPRAVRARLPDCPENVLRLAEATPVSAVPVGHRHHR